MKKKEECWKKKKSNFEKKNKQKNRGKVGKKEKSKKKKEKSTVDYYCNPQGIRCGGIMISPTPFSFMYNNILKT